MIFITDYRLCTKRNNITLDVSTQMTCTFIPFPVPSFISFLYFFLFSLFQNNKRTISQLLTQRQLQGIARTHTHAHTECHLTKFSSVTTNVSTLLVLQFLLTQFTHVTMYVHTSSHAQ